MVCSHCKIVGHTYRKCPTITPEEKIAKKKDIQKKKDELIQRRNAYLALINQQQSPPPPPLPPTSSINISNYDVSNMTDQEMVLYFSHGDPNSILVREITQVCYIEPHTVKPIYLKGKHDGFSLYVFPILEVLIDANRLEAYKKITLSVNPETGNIVCPYSCVLHLKMNDHNNNSIIIDCDYMPKKTELEKWKEFALKSKFLLDQIFTMTGGGKTTQYENIEPFLDMIEDINIPECSEFDKEKAGVPSILTNIT